MAEHRKLAGRQGRSAPIGGWGAVLFGLPFLGAGVFAALAPRLAPENVNGPVQLVYWAAAVFGLAGLYMIWIGLRRLRRRAVAARLRELHPGEPWLWDHSWSRQGARGDVRRRALAAVAGAGAFAVFLAPFNVIAFGMDGVSPRALWVGVVVVFDLVTVGIIVHAIYLVMRWLKYGVATVTFGRFPFVLGEEGTIHFEGTARGEPPRTLTATLRCVEEAYETSGSGKNRSTKTVCYEVHADTRTVDDVRGRWEGRRGLALSYVFPAAAPPTRLSERPPRYWELEIGAEVPGIDYQGRFLLPVYAARTAS